MRRLSLLFLILVFADTAPAAVVRAWSMMHRWPQQTVYYYVDEQDEKWIHKLTKQPTPWTYDVAPAMWGKSIKQTIADGLKMLTDANPGLRFVNIDQPDARRYPHAVRIRQRPEILITGMATANGFSNGRSSRYEIHINKWNHAGIVAHEMLHILGVSHAQSAANRETFAIVYTGQSYLKGTPQEFTVPDNVRSGHGNFNLLTGRRILGGYDFDSIMHYSDSIMKKRGTKNPPVIPKVTIGRRISPGPLKGATDSLPKTGIRYWNEDGNGRSYHAQRSHLSPIDSWALREMYFHTTNPETGADFNGDGYADLIVGSQVIYGDMYSSDSPGLDARNLPKATKRLPFPVHAVIHGDFNGDYRMDAAIHSDDGIHVLYSARDNNGRDGELGLSGNGRRLGSGNRHGEWAVGDFNRDGYSDLVWREESHLQLLAGSSQGFTRPSVVKIDLGIEKVSKTTIAVGDFNGDGFTDLALVAGGGDLQILRGSETGLTRAAAGIPPAADESWSGPATVGDFNCDGLQDLAISSLAGRITVFHGERRGHGINADSQSRRFIIHTARSLLAADLNGDGYSDLAIGDPSTKGGGSVHIINGAPTGLTPSTASTVYPKDAVIQSTDSGFGSSLARGDFDGNGYVDLVIGTRNDPVLRYHGSPHDGPKTVIGRSFPAYDRLNLPK